MGGLLQHIQLLTGWNDDTWKTLLPIQRQNAIMVRSNTPVVVLVTGWMAITSPNQQCHEALKKYTYILINRLKKCDKAHYIE